MATSVAPLEDFTPSADGDSDLIPRDLAFLGEEFLTWLSFRLDSQGGHFALAKSGDVDVWIDDRVLLTERGVENAAETSVKGGDPARAPETQAALAGGKMFARARVGVRKQDKEWSLTLDNQLVTRGLKLPALMTDEADEKLFERVALLEELNLVFDELFEEFCDVRFGELWEKSVLPAMRKWAHGQE